MPRAIHFHQDSVYRKSARKYSTLHLFQSVANRRNAEVSPTHHVDPPALSAGLHPPRCRRCQVAFLPQSERDLSMTFEGEPTGSRCRVGFSVERGENRFAPGRDREENAVPLHAFTYRPRFSGSGHKECRRGRSVERDLQFTRPIFHRLSPDSLLGGRSLESRQIGRAICHLD